MWWIALMADFKKLRRNLPPPPTADQAPANLSQPETAPSDGRSARATGRTKQLATRVREDFHDELKVYAASRRLKLVQVLEMAFDALKEKDR
jgi:hypothetical protein